MRFDNLIIYSDVDGTATYSIGRKVYVSKENKDAINDFVKNGGLFGVASGRSHDSILKTFVDININMPLVESNGAAVYDFDKQEYLFTNFMSKEAKEFVYKLILSNKNLMMTALDEFDTYKIITNDERDAWVLDFKRDLISYDELMDKRILKCAILALKEDIDSILNVIKDNEYLYHLKSARSADIYLEMFDLFAGKDLGIKRVIEEYSLDNKTLVCIGDHYNDIEMVKMADIAICPKNAVDEVKNICEYVADDCHNNAIKGAIEYLRSR